MKKSSKTVKERVKTFINLYKDLQELAKIIQEQIKWYYNLKVSKELNFKKRDKVWLLHKNISSR